MKINKTAKGGFKKTFPELLKKEVFSKYAGTSNKRKTKPRMIVLFFWFTFCSSPL
jgi:hypothetical protein